MSKVPQALRLLATPLLVAGALAASTAPASAAPVKPVAHVDVSRYLGSWKQIAAIPAWYEAACVRNVTATYTLNSDNTIRVANRCFNPLGQVTSTGRARVLDHTTDAQLQVAFFQLAGQWAYLGTAPNYVIMGLDPQYGWAVVGDPQHQSAFVLSRAAALSSAQTTEVQSILVQNGYDPCRLKVTPQSGGLTKAADFC
jgi:apolipoprotein D and lipocalin family protein